MLKVVQTQGSTVVCLQYSRCTLEKRSTTGPTRSCLGCAAFSSNGGTPTWAPWHFSLMWSKASYVLSDTRSLWTRILWGRALMKSLLWHCHATTNLSGQHLENRTSVSLGQLTSRLGQLHYFVQKFRDIRSKEVSKNDWKIP